MARRKQREPEWKANLASDSMNLHALFFTDMGEGEGELVIREDSFHFFELLNDFTIRAYRHHSSNHVDISRGDSPSLFKKILEGGFAHKAGQIDEKASLADITEITEKELRAERWD